MPPERTDLFEAEPADVELGPGARILRGFASAEASALLASIAEISATSPFRRMTTPGGWRMSVAMTNCGEAGWITDRTGYRYDRIDPVSGRAWPTMPTLLQVLARRAAEAAGFDDFTPDACLINRYDPGARLSLHQDRSERDLSAPIVLVSLGLPAVFLWGGLKRAERPRRHTLLHGDVVVWGGPTRLAFHGVDHLTPARHALTGVARYNLTFRRAL